MPHRSMRGILIKFISCKRLRSCRLRILRFYCREEIKSIQNNVNVFVFKTTTTMTYPELAPNLMFLKFEKYIFRTVTSCICSIHGN